MKLARQPFYRWLTAPVSDRDLAEAHLANALVDAHADDPDFEYRLLADLNLGRRSPKPHHS